MNLWIKNLFCLMQYGKLCSQVFAEKPYGLVDGKLRVTQPGSLNSISSENGGVEPIILHLPFETFAQKIEALDHVRLLGTEEDQEGPIYYHFVFSTPWLGFDDDVEIRKKGNVAHIRSASRVGISDLGVNKARVEKLRVLAQPNDRAP